MSAVKERLFGAFTTMSESDAQSLWEIIESSYSNTVSKDWNDIEEVTPDEIDIAMLADIAQNPDCKEFI